MRPVLACLVLSLAVGFAYAEQEEPESHAAHTTHTVLLTRQDVRPSTVDMSQGDVLEFENQSFYPITVTFTEPTDLRERIRCGLIGDKPASEPKAPWLLFAWSDGKLAATMPPGRFASICSFTPGTYRFTATRAGGDFQGTSTGNLPVKGEVRVK